MEENATKRPVSITHTFDYFEDQEYIKMLTDHRDFCIKLEDIYNLCRSQLKHGDEELSDTIEKLLEDIKELAYVELS